MPPCDPRRSAARPTTSCRGRRRRRRRPDRPTGSTATSTIRTWSNASRPGSSIRFSAICTSRRRTATTRISAASRSRRRSCRSERTCTTFEATITGATANPPNITQLLTPPAAGRRRAGARRPRRAGTSAVAVREDRRRRLSDHRRIRRAGGRVQGPRRRARRRSERGARPGGHRRSQEARIPNKPIRYVVNTHAHFDHASGLAPFAAEGITIITHENNKSFLEKALSAPRTLVGDTLAKADKKPKVESAGDKRVLKDDTHTIELLSHQGPRALRRHARRVPAEGKDPLHRGLQHPGSGSAA